MWHRCCRGCVAPDMVAWVRQQAARLPRVPSLAFVHIPLPQMAAAWNSGAAVNGSKGELVGCPGADSGFFAAARSVGCKACGLWPALTPAPLGMRTGMHSTMIVSEMLVLPACREFGIGAVYSGHDHHNDFSGSLEGVRLAYGRKSGCAAGPTVVPHGRRRGVSSCAR